MSQHSIVNEAAGRRAFFRRAGLGCLVSTIANRLCASDDSLRSDTTADACILVFLTGGPSHLDSWDPKPEAPAEVRGPFKTIATCLPGVRLSEHVPKLAGLLHKTSLIRSLHHTAGSHIGGSYVSLTGVDDGPTRGPAGPSDHPSLGAVVAKHRPPDRFPLPYVWLPYRTTEIGLGTQPLPGIQAGFLGGRYDPFFLEGDPSDPDFNVPALRLPPNTSTSRFRNKLDLLTALDSSCGLMDDELWNYYRKLSAKLIADPAIRKVLSLADEPYRLQQAYGESPFGASLLLARRLIEAGSRVVGVSFAETPNKAWDTHDNNFVRLERSLLPKTDAGISTLLTDLESRGLLQRTLVYVFGEFGRSPTISEQSGREHWPGCFSALLAGGGVRQGVVYGASDSTGASPAEDPVTPADVLSTIYQRLGLSTENGFRIKDLLDRPTEPAPHGKPITDVIT